MSDEDRASASGQNDEAYDVDSFIDDEELMVDALRGMHAVEDDEESDAFDDAAMADESQGDQPGEQGDTTGGDEADQEDAGEDEEAEEDDDGAGDEEDEEDEGEDDEEDEEGDAVGALVGDAVEDTDDPSVVEARRILEIERQRAKERAQLALASGSTAPRSPEARPASVLLAEVRAFVAAHKDQPCGLSGARESAFALTLLRLRLWRSVNALGLPSNGPFDDGIPEVDKLDPDLAASLTRLVPEPEQESELVAAGVVGRRSVAYIGACSLGRVLDGGRADPTWKAPRVPPSALASMLSIAKASSANHFLKTYLVPAWRARVAWCAAQRLAAATQAVAEAIRASLAGGQDTGMKETHLEQMRLRGSLPAGTPEPALADLREWYVVSPGTRQLLQEAFAAKQAWIEAERARKDATRTPRAFPALLLHTLALGRESRLIAPPVGPALQQIDPPILNVVRCRPGRDDEGWAVEVSVPAAHRESWFVTVAGSHRWEALHEKASSSKLFGSVKPNLEISGYMAHLCSYIPDNGMSANRLNSLRGSWNRSSQVKRRRLEQHTAASGLLQQPTPACPPDPAVLASRHLVAGAGQPSSAAAQSAQPAAQPTPPVLPQLPPTLQSQSMGCPVAVFGAVAEDGAVDSVVSAGSPAFRTEPPARIAASAVPFDPNSPAVQKLFGKLQWPTEQDLQRTDKTK